MLNIKYANITADPKYFWSFGAAGWQIRMELTLKKILDPTLENKPDSALLNSTQISINVNTLLLNYNSLLSIKRKILT